MTLKHWTRGNAGKLASARQEAPRIMARYPREADCTGTGCGWDEYTQSGKRIDCPVCRGKGKVTTWQTWYFRARVNWPGLIQFSFAAPSPGVDLGDVTLTISPSDEPLLQQVKAAERAYLIVEEKTVRPTVIQKLDIPQIGEEYSVVCHLHTVTT